MKKTTFILCAAAMMLVACNKSVSNYEPAQFTKHLEPMSWWAGMAHNELQLMLHGDSIAACEVHFDGLKIARVERTDNPNYLFVYVNTKGAKAGVYQLHIRRDGKEQVVDYQLNEREKGSAERQSFSSADVVYLIMPDRFANGNPENDNADGYNQTVDFGNLDQRQGGDIQGIIDHLDYIADLGMTAIWCTPFTEDNDVIYSYHHYACSDYYKIDPRLGSNEDYKRLADACHAQGLKLIMDIVPNHCGITHWWMNDLPDSTWLHIWPEFTRTNYNVSIWTNENASDYDLTRLERAWFDTNMPDINLANTLIFDYLRQAYTYWIEYAGVDGLRVDTYPYNDIFDAARLMNALNAEYPNLSLVGECWVKTVPQTAFYQTGANNKNGFDSGLQSVMDFTLKDYFEWFFQEDEAWNKGTIRFYDHFAQNFVFPNQNMVMNMLDNHDMDRFAALVHRNPKLYKMGLAVISTIRGFPQFYYGDEIMIDGDAGRYEDARHTFPGGWAADTHNAFEAAQRTELENDIHDYLKSLLTFRKSCTALHDGKMKQFLPNDGIYVYFRYNDEHKVMVVVNNSNYDKHVDLQRYNEMDIVGHAAYDVAAHTTLELGETLDVPAKTVLVLDIAR